MTGVMTELILRECMEKTQAESSLVKPKINNNVKIELSKEHLKELQNYAFSISEEEDVVDHIAKVLEILDLIKILMWTPIDYACMFFLSRLPVLHKNASKYDVTRDDEDEGHDYFKFVTWLNSKFKDHRRMDGMTKSALWHYWVKGEGNNELMDDIESSDEELEESDYGNPRNTDTDSFFKPYLDTQEKDNIYEIEKGNIRNQKYSGATLSR
ncbi:hypothetical protein Tco_0957196 [Tanacetum coccineum]